MGRSRALKIHEENLVYWENRTMMKSILKLIKSINLKDQKKKDGEIDIKMFVTILDQVGDLIKKEDDFYKNKENLEVVREFIDWFISQRLYEDPEYREIMTLKRRILNEK
jgi:hypothetical protein